MAGQKLDNITPLPTMTSRVPMRQNSQMRYVQYLAG